LARPLEFDELVDYFTLVDEDLALLRNKTDATQNLALARAVSSARLSI
jgi:hypothetical protein